MGMENYSRHQQGIIKRYYRNFDAIQAQRLADLCTEIYLSEGKKRERHWKQVGEVLKKLEFPESRIAHVLTKQDPALLPELLKELESSGGT